MAATVLLGWWHLWERKPLITSLAGVGPTYPDGCISSHLTQTGGGRLGKAIIHIHASLAMNRQAGVMLYHRNRLFPEGSPPLYQTEIQDTFESKMFSMVVTSPNACCLNQVRT